MVDKSEMVEVLEQMNCYRIRQTGFSRLWKQFQQHKFNKYFIQVTGRNLSLKYSVPDWMKDTQTVLNIVKSLDEGREFITDDSFSSFKPSVHNFKIDYMCVRGRNM